MKGYVKPEVKVIKIEASDVLNYSSGAETEVTYVQID